MTIIDGVVLTLTPQYGAAVISATAGATVLGVSLAGLPGAIVGATAGAALGLKVAYQRRADDRRRQQLG
jgi:hypothetical protein